ncbi:2-oxo-tetronate isomerase [Arthrobacter sp. H14-L1]|uniref:2-oxo-tetronate isomerase n=1 Tax=Arthrobacter sp. H14-L1 TaxID=2996697 RepID=UPI002D1E3D91|nr:2-oxo-tetronate isomerase [Arthrobacter sp. H14-L1]
MPRFAANLSMMFTEVPFLERFKAAFDAGFKAVEYLFPYDHPKTQIAEQLEVHGLKQALFNAYAGDWDGSERGLASLAGRQQEFRESIAQALEYAQALGCPKVHIMAGIAEVTEKTRALYVENLQYAADQAAALNIEVLIEPINARDMPGYFLGSVAQAIDLLKSIDRANARLQFDYYHAQITSGDVTMLMRDSMERIGHIQIASVPARNEPDTGELNYPYVLAALDAAGYDGWVGCEYRPAGETASGLGWLASYRNEPK